MSRQDITRLVVAHHEAGHAIAHRVAGGRIQFVKVGRDGRGNTRTVENGPTPGKELDWLVMIAAGGRAEHRFLTEQGYSDREARALVEANTSGDQANFRALSQGTGITRRQADKAADKLVSRHWGRIQKLAARLDNSGRVSGFWL
ncbi:hypothetical protein [Amycolatopsis magusensis]|uniref:hypothetical protein n=1 Tax=Amycolatopsis magusensis TaxID=882444 RepID=UPI0037A25685